MNALEKGRELAMEIAIQGLVHAETLPDGEICVEFETEKIAVLISKAIEESTARKSA